MTRKLTQPMVRTLQHKRSRTVSQPRRKSKPKRMKSWQRTTSRLERNLAASGEWYLKVRSFADAYLYVLTGSNEQTPLSIDNYPNLKKHRARMEADEGVRLALQRQDMTPCHDLHATINGELSWHSTSCLQEEFKLLLFLPTN